MQHLKPIDYLIRSIIYAMETGVKLELTKNLILTEGLSVRLHLFYDKNPDLIGEHLELIPDDIREIVEKDFATQRYWLMDITC